MKTRFYGYSILVLGLAILPASCKITISSPSPPSPSIKAWVVSTLAGRGTGGFANGAGTWARFNYPTGVAVDSAGNVYVGDEGNHRIRKITAAKVLVVSTIAGSATAGFRDDTGAAARFHTPRGMAVDSGGNVYVADDDNHRIRKITAAGEVSTLAGSGAGGHRDDTGTAAQFNRPYGVALDTSGNVYVADRENHRIRKITAAGEVSTIAGSGAEGFANGRGASAQFNEPRGVAVDSAGDVYVADSGNHRIRKITAAGEVSTLAGSGTRGFANGIGTAAEFNNPTGVAVDSVGNVYVADEVNHLIRKITAAGEVSTIAGSGREGHRDGTGTATRFHQPTGVAVDTSGNVYVADYINERIRKITEAGEVSTPAGSGTKGHRDGTSTAAQFNQPYGVAVDTSGNVYVADSGNNRIRKIEVAKAVLTLAGRVAKGFANGRGTAAQFNNPYGVAVDSAGNIYVADRENHRIRKITIKTVNSQEVADVDNLAGSGTPGSANGRGTSAQFHDPRGVAVDTSGNVYVADSGNHRIRKITAAGVVSTLAGSGAEGFANGIGTSAQFHRPHGVAVDSANNVYVADSGNHRIRKITIKTENSQEVVEVSTLAGSGAEGFANGIGTSAQFNNPRGVAVDSSGNVYVADTSNYRIRKITTTGVVSTLAGSGREGHKDGTGTAALFYSPNGVAVDSSGNLYVADTGAQRILKIEYRVP